MKFAGRISISLFIAIRRPGKNNTRVVPDDVRKVFAEYPNVINEIINLSLSNGATLDEGEQVVNLPNAFIEQFKTGQAKEIDTAICAKNRRL